MKALLLLLVAVAVGLAFVGTTAAAPPLVATSIVTGTSDVVVSARQSGPNLIIIEEDSTNVATDPDTGDVVGTSSLTLRGVVHADGSAEFNGRGTHTGTLPGCGQVTFDFDTWFRVDASGQFAGGSAAIAGSPVTLNAQYGGSVFDPNFMETFTYKC
jgi:hypothetical protein